MTSLEAYEREHRIQIGPACTCCAVRSAHPDLWSEVLQARAERRTTYRMIAGYLSEKTGTRVTRAMLSHHLSNHEGNQ